MDASYRFGDDDADNGRGRSEASLDLRSGVLFEGIPSRLWSPIKKKMTKNLFLVTLFFYCRNHFVEIFGIIWKNVENFLNFASHITERI